MATGDTTARNSRASDFSADFTTSSLVIKAGATTLATHTLAGFGVAATDTADTATLSDTAGTYTLTVGTVGSGADLELSTLTYISGETSTISSLAVTFPA